jgi:hypothetical protein
MDYRRTLPEFREEMARLDAHATGDAPEYQAHIVGDRYAVVLTGTDAPNEIMCWCSNVNNALMIAHALNEAEGL